MFARNDYALFFWNDTILTQKQDLNYVIALEDTNLGLTKNDYYFLGNFDNRNIYTVNLNSPAIENQANHLFMPARDLLKTVDLQAAKLILRGKQLLNWHCSSLYCGCCGCHTVLSDIEIAKICSDCQKVIYPSSFPAVIVLIEHKDKILLARSPHFPKGMYSTLAGFIEAGESCEDAISREVLEEVGVAVKNIRYFSSQSWPFPNSFMLGFKAQYASGEICFDNKEIEDAKWFNKSNLPNLPSESSIARHMIDSFFS